MKRLLILATLPFLFASCAQDSLTGNSYSRHEAGQAQSVRMGRITSIRGVEIEGNKTGGALVGAAAGGFLGNQVGSGSGQTAATVGGALLGGAAGSHAGKAITAKQGLEIQVKLDEGGSISVVQEVDKNESFSQGDRVRVLSNGGRTRVTH
ncbi:glycine zipper 2TM domain-containing protein [Haloferula sp.]|uniref:glycine zipper 2TM domain-containing protein n=1 Tax=Haloferula sp. TaxID=2497595 RepID=UPI00329D8494